MPNIDAKLEPIPEETKQSEVCSPDHEILLSAY